MPNTGEWSSLCEYKTVLIVDDELVIQYLLVQQLKCFGVSTCQTAGTGREALEQLRHDVPDLVICDLKLPDIDGPQLIRALAELGYQGSILIITGSDTRILNTLELLTEELGLHLIGAMIKPINPYELEWLLQTPAPTEGQRELKRGPRSQFVIDETMVEAGLSRDAVVPYYQAKWNPLLQKVTGFEVLSRWLHDDGRVLGPGAFIPVIERRGLLTSFTMQLLDQVLKDSKRLFSASPDLNIALNFGIESLQDRQLPDELIGRLEAHDVKPQQLTIEVTERGLVEDAPNVLEVMARLHLLGFRLSIDDFGTGYSSFSRAKGLPFTELKIDRAFVKDADTNHSSRAVIKSSIALAADLGMQVIAEGVETAESMSLMSDMGCQVIQGFHIARPEPLQVALAFLTSQAPALTDTGLAS